MPPRYRGGSAPSKPDPLDVALASSKAPPASGFFQALKPTSPLFAQTSRINVDRPAAQQRQQARVVPPPQAPRSPQVPAGPTPAQIAAEKARVAAEIKSAMSHSSSVGDLAKGAVRTAERAVKTVAANPRLAITALAPGPLSFLANPVTGYLAHAANQKAQEGVSAFGKTMAGSPPSAADVQGNASILDAYKSGGETYASLAPEAQKKLAQAVAFFATHPTYHYDVPNVGIYNAKIKAQYHLPPTATDADVYRKAYEPWDGHRDYISGLVHNIPLNLAQNVAAPLGLLDVATHPTTMGPEFLRQQVDFGKQLVEHPLKTLHDQPVTTLTTALAAARFAGGAGGTFGRSRFNPSDALRQFATPSAREVVPKSLKGRAVGPGGEDLARPISRGLTSPKLDVAAAQAVTDALARHTNLFGNRLAQHRADEITKEANLHSHQLIRDNVEPMVRASAKLRKNARRANTSFIGQGYHSLDEAAAHAAQAVDAHGAQEAAAQAAGRHLEWQQVQHDLVQKAELTKRLAAKVDTSTPKFQEALAANTQASRAGEQQMVAQGVADPATLERSAYIPRARIDAELHHDPIAQRLLATTERANALTDELAKARRNSPRAAALRRQIDQLERVQADQQGAARPERGTSERLAQQRANLFSGQHEAPLTPDPFGADNPRPSARAFERSDMRLGVENRTRARAERPLAARIERANARLAKVVTPEQVQHAIEGNHAEQADLVAHVRAQFRAQRGAPEVAPHAPLDVHDPLWMHHALESPRTFFGLRSGQSMTGTNLDPRAAYARERRLGTAGHQRTGGLMAQSATDPSIFFQGAEKPFRVTAKLRHLSNQIADSIKAPAPGTRYDTRRYVLVDISKRGQGALDVHTNVDHAQAVHELGDGPLHQQIVEHFRPPTDLQGHTAVVPADGGEYYLMTKNARAAVEATIKPRSQSGFMQVVRNSTNFWRWLTLTARPAWLVNNFGGATIQALLEGVGPRSMARALRTGTGGKYEGVIPPQVNNGGFAANFLERPEKGVRNGLMRPVDRVTRGIMGANAKVDNVMRRAVALQESLNIAKGKAHGEHRTIANNLHRVTGEVIDLARNRTPENDAAIMARVNHALGDFIGKGTAGPIPTLISPFKNWFTFITKLTLAMPVRTPGRALLIQRLGQFGINVQNQETGGFIPNNWLGQIHIPDAVPIFGGQYKSTQALNPIATPYQLFAPQGQDTTDPGQISYTGFLGALNPAILAALEFATGKNPTFDFADLKDASGNPTGPANLGVLGHAIENSFPITNLATGYGTTDVSVNPWAPETRARGAYSQPQQSFSDRLAGYLAGGVAPRDPRLNYLSSWNRMVSAVNSEALHRANAGHGPRAKKK